MRTYYYAICNMAQYVIRTIDYHTIPHDSGALFYRVRTTYPKMCSNFNVFAGGS